MRLLALQPFDGGSHQAFLDGWREHSRHTWTVLTLSPHHWKWRMRHAPITFADHLRTLLEQGSRWDLLLCTDMLDLAAFAGLAPAPVACLPRVVYFHENQLTYPTQSPRERDLHFAFTNLTTALAATAVWFNSDFHRGEFLNAFRRLLPRLPDHQPRSALDRIAARCEVQPPGIVALTPSGERPGPLHIVWAARWEFDKAPEIFFEALRRLPSGSDVRLSVLGQTFRDTPACFAIAEREFADRLSHFGFLPRSEYQATLQAADVFVSTAIHEFFGIAAVEAISAGLFPLLPNRLSYPELLEYPQRPEMRGFYYDGQAATLAQRLGQLADTKRQTGSLWAADPERARRRVARFAWPRRARQLDDAVERCLLGPDASR